VVSKFWRWQHSACGVARRLRQAHHRGRAKIVNAELCTLSVGNRALRGELTYLAAMRTGELGILIQSLAACAIQAVGQNELQ
jgi:hypothetical protein